MRLYPQLPGARSRTIAADLVVVALLVVFAWAGMKVHDTVIELNALSRGVTEAGTAVNSTFGKVADAVDDVPLVGGPLGDGLRAGSGVTAGNVAKAGAAGGRAVDRTANALGWATFALPALVLLAVFLPFRVIQVRRLTRAHRMLGTAPPTGERERLLAMRAAFGLPWAALAGHTRDPIGDLESGRYEPLVAALYADAGLRPPAGG